MGRPKGSGKKHTEDAKEAVHGKKTGEQDLDAPIHVPVPIDAIPQVKDESIPEAVTYPFDTVVWSEDNPPLLLKAGTPIPAGYKRERSEVKQHWVHDDRGVWSKGERP